MNRWLSRSDVPRGADYDARWTALEASGATVHGEADLIASYVTSVAADVVRGGKAPCVLDAGCGTGRVAIELARRGIEVVGVDIDPAMLEQARRKHPTGQWEAADLSTLDLRADGHRLLFDIVALPGNVMIFLAPGSESLVLARLAAHLVPNGLLIAGFQLKVGRLDLSQYDRLASEAGLRLEARFATWDKEPFVQGGDYAVSVHRLGESSA